MALERWLRGLARSLPGKSRPRFRLVVGVAPATADVVREAISRHNVRRAVVVLGYERLTDTDFGCDRFRETDLIPTNSDAEEAIYRETALHRDEMSDALRSQTYRGVEVAPDFQRSVMPPAERMLHVSRAAQLLFARGYEFVAIVLEGYTLYHQCLVAEAKACGLMEPAEEALKVVNRRLEPATELSTRTARPVSLWRAALQHSVPEAPAETDALVFALTASPVYLRNGMEVVHALGRRGARTQVLCETPAQQQAAAVFGVETSPIGRDLQTSDANAIIEAAASFVAAWDAEAAKRLHDSNKPSFQDFGRHTLDALDATLFMFEEAIAGLVRMLVRIENIDAIILARPNAAIYKVPHVSTTCDHTLLALARKNGRRHVASVYLSTSDSYRNLDHAEQDILTTLGDGQTEIIKRLGLAAEVISAGQPEMDTIDRDWPEQRSRDHVAGAVPELGGRKLITVATSGIDLDGELDWIEALVGRCKERGDCFVVVKMHPSNPGERHRQRLARAGRPVAIVQDPLLAPYIRAASVVATDVSHAGKIAVYLDRPLLVANFSSKPYPYHRIEEDRVAQLATEPAQVSSLLDDALDRPERNAAAREAFVRREFTSDDGKAADRIADAILRSAAAG